MNPKRGQYNWAAADQEVTLARSFGMKERMFVFCGTPQWAGRKAKKPSDEVRGPRSTTAPKKMKDYERFVTQFVKRYRDDYDAYQSWNEITSTQFWQGTPRQAATMTAVLRKVVKKHDPTAKVVSASVQTHKPWLHDPTAKAYFNQLKRKKWPVDVIAVHGYAAGPVKNVTNTRVKQVRRMQGILDRYRPPSRIKMWDTEVNYEAPGNGNPQGRIKGNRAGAFLARTFLDSFRLGLDRTYWYLWKTEYYDFPSIQLRPGDPATRSFNTLGRWITGTKYQGCKTRKGIATCTFKPNGKPAFRVAWANTGKKTYTTKKAKTFCKVTGGKCKKAKRYGLNEIPVRVS